MKSCLPSKLIILRKHFNYSQQDMAKKLHVSINEYIAFENGNAMCSLAQLEELADIFGLTFDEMLINTVDIDLPEIEESIEIPFLNNVEEAIDEPDDDDDLVKTTRMVMHDEPKTIPNNLGDTIVAPIITDSDKEYDTHEDNLAKTMVTKVVKDDKDVPKNSSNMPSNQKKKNRNLPLVIGAGVVAIIVVAFLVWMLFFKNSSTTINNGLSNTNRLVTTSNYSAFLQDNKNVQFTGDNVNINMSDVVQISAYDKFIVGLKSDGSVEVSNSLDVEQLQDITMVAAGDNHVAAIDSEGNLQCVGNEAACNITDQDIKFEKVFAGKNETLAIDSNGTLYAYGSGSFVNSVDGLEDVNKIVTYEDAAIVLKKDGTVTTYGKTYDTSSWKGIIDVAIGQDYVIGLENDGTLIISGNEEFVGAQDDFTNVRYVSAFGDYFVACDSNGACYGYGNAANNRFVEKSGANQLNSVQNMNASISAKKVNFTWDAVQDADHYRVAINTSDNYNVNSATNSLSVDASKFVDGTSYVVTITAYSDDEFEPSEPSEFEFNYVANTNTLDTPTNIKGIIEGNNVTFSWDAVANARRYNFEIPELGIKEELNANTKSMEVSSFSEGVTYTINITALGNDNYSDSQVGSIKYTYQSPKEKLAMVNNISAAIDGNYVKISWSSVANASSYTVSIDVDNYSETTSSTEIMVEASKFASGNNYTISVVANGTGKYENSDARTYTYTHTIPSFTITYKDQNGNVINSSSVTSGSSIKLNANITIPNYNINSYRINAASYDPNADYMVNTNTEITIEGACAIEGTTYKNYTEGCLCPDGQQPQNGACATSSPEAE